MWPDELINSPICYMQTQGGALTYNLTIYIYCGYLTMKEENPYFLQYQSGSHMLNHMLVIMLYLFLLELAAILDTRLQCYQCYIVGDIWKYTRPCR